MRINVGYLRKNLRLIVPLAVLILFAVAILVPIAFMLISIAMLAGKGLGYYYEFIFGKERERRDFMY